MLHAKIEQARIAGNILNMYSNVQKLTVPIINQVEFEKSVREDKIFFSPDEVMQKWCSDKVQAIEAEKDTVRKAQLDSVITESLLPLRKIDVIFDSVKKSVWVDIFDPEKQEYKDNSLTRKLGLVKVEDK